MDSKHTKHEIIQCERCGSSMECKANNFTKCQCSTVQLNLNELQYINENYEGCMCAACLGELKVEYNLAMFPKGSISRITISSKIPKSV